MLELRSVWASARRLEPSAGARRPSGGVPRVRTRADVMRAVGRGVLWGVLVLLLVRGALDVLASQTSVAGAPARAWAKGVWPDDGARAFAVRFVAAYLAHSSRDLEGQARAVAGFASPELAGELPGRVDERAPRQVVRSAVVAGVVAINARRALVTVAATVEARRVRTVLVTVPVARDAAGGLVVYDAPSLAPTAARATVGREYGTPLLGSEGAAVRDVLARFLRAYLVGDSGGLTYLVAPGTRLGATAGGFELVQLGSIAAVSARKRATRLRVLATTHARDIESRAVYALRFRVLLVRRDRWYVAGLDNSPTGGGRP